MKIKEIIRVMHAFQKWRRGADMPMPDPKEIGRAIDGAIRELRNFQRLKIRIEKPSNSTGFAKERNELLRWRDPNVERPKDGEEVLVKADCPYCRYDVMKHDAFGWWEKTSLAGGGWYKAKVEITGWRPIQEE